MRAKISGIYQVIPAAARSAVADGIRTGSPDLNNEKSNAICIKKKDLSSETDPAPAIGSGDTG